MLTRTIKVSCLSCFLPKTLRAVWQKTQIIYGPERSLFLLPVPCTGIVFRQPINLVPRSRQYAIKFVPWRQKHVPYPPCTVTTFWLKYQDPARCCRRVTQPPHIAGPLGVTIWSPPIALTYYHLAACPNLFAGNAWQFSHLYKINNIKNTTLDSRKRARPSASYFCAAREFSTFYLDEKVVSPFAGLPRHTLAYDNSRFCIRKFTKPDDEHHLQSLSCASANLFSYTPTVFVHLDIASPNTDGWGNKLVTIFARHLDSYILTQNLSLIYQIRDFGSGQILHPRLLYLSPGLAKTAQWRLARQDSFLLFASMVLPRPEWS